MNSLSLLRFLSIFALIFLNVAVANPVEIGAWDAFSLTPSNDDGREPSDSGATNMWAQTPDNIDNSPAKPLDGSDPSICFGKRTKNLGKRQAKHEMCQDNSQMNRKAGQTPVEHDPVVRKPVDSTNMPFRYPQKFSTDEEKVCAKAPESAIQPVCALIESVVAGLLASFVDLDSCRPCEFFFLNTDNSKRNGNRNKARKPNGRRAIFWGEIYLGYDEIIDLGSKIQTSSTHPASFLNTSGAAIRCFSK